MHWTSVTIAAVWPIAGIALTIRFHRRLDQLDVSPTQACRARVLMWAMFVATMAFFVLMLLFIARKS